MRTQCQLHVLTSNTLYLYKHYTLQPLLMIFTEKDKQTDKSINFIFRSLQNTLFITHTNEDKQVISTVIQVCTRSTPTPT